MSTAVTVRLVGNFRDPPWRSLDLLEENISSPFFGICPDVQTQLGQDSPSWAKGGCLSVPPLDTLCLSPVHDSLEIQLNLSFTSYKSDEKK